ncbi:hypothetical protein A2361_00680 [Candidatus Woesebacteria bacterium RIFOXYB1_FULL_40_26]|uniref:Uncharacterized protein n=1 Tax=Candidatus Woesebacteria bacterium RIFOXYB1_FULL_40_26 TaxID=1802539 RepID=A0A1F8CV82_9BACT|nr:MAG: hypothetical protein A2361_00680 [Candidatus Woesebacteria bacterium RIFOXYB1_FULL_40_26]
MNFCFHEMNFTKFELKTQRHICSFFACPKNELRKCPPDNFSTEFPFAHTYVSQTPRSKPSSDYRTFKLYSQTPILVKN